MRASRLVSILLLLQARGRMTAAELAAAFEVSPRTIYRDVEALGAAGVPLYGEAGHEGGYQVLAGYRTSLTGLTAHEARALPLVGLGAVAAQLGLGPEAGAAQLKLRAALPGSHREQAQRLNACFHLDTDPWYAPHEEPAHLHGLAAAVWDRRAVTVGYQRWTEPHDVTRELEPWGLVLKAGRWYLVARDDSGTKTYRVSRIASLEPTGRSFERPADFDLAAHWRDYLLAFDARRIDSTATIRVSPSAFARLPHLPGALAPTSSTPVGDDGWREVTVPVEVAEQAALDLLQLGPEAEVVAPPALRARVRELVESMTELYR